MKNKFELLDKLNNCNICSNCTTLEEIQKEVIKVRELREKIIKRAITILREDDLLLWDSTINMQFTLISAVKALKIENSISSSEANEFLKKNFNNDYLVHWKYSVNKDYRRFDSRVDPLEFYVDQYNSYTGEKNIDDLMDFKHDILEQISELDVDTPYKSLKIDDIIVGWFDVLYEKNDLPENLKSLLKRALEKLYIKFKISDITKICNLAHIKFDEKDPLAAYSTNIETVKSTLLRNNIECNRKHARVIITTIYYK